MKKVVTKQGIFNHVYRFLVKQGVRAIKDNMCVYRAPQVDGRVFACAAGCLVSDEEAKQLLSGNWHHVVRDGYAPARFAPHENFIRHLQKIHDYDFTSITHFKNTMASLAALHGLTVPEDV